MGDDKNNIYLDFGRRLKAARKSNKVTQNDLAERVGLSRTSITNIERGRQQVSLHVFLSLSKAVGIEPVRLLPDMGLLAPVDQKLKDEVKKQTQDNVEATAVMRSIAKLKGDG